MATDRLSKLRGVDPIQTALGVGYHSAEFIADILFPPVDVDQESGKYPVDNLARFQIGNTVRALKADSNRAPSNDVTLADFILQEHDNYEAVDYREEIAGLLFSPKTRARRLAQERIMRGKEVEAATLALNAGSYAAGNASALAGPARWDQYSTSDPFQDKEFAADVVRQKTGQLPDLMIVSHPVRSMLANHPDVLEKIKYSQVGIVTDELLAAAFGVKKFVVASAQYSTNGNTLTDIWGKAMILAVTNPAVQQTRDIWEPSFGKTIQLRGGQFADEYPLDGGGKVTAIRWTDIYAHKITQNYAAFLLDTVVN